MGPKRKRRSPTTTNSSTENKKRRRVDSGIEPKDCIKIYLVSSKEEFFHPENFVIDHVDLNCFFGDDGKIYGYEGLEITVWISSISFRAYAEIAFRSSSNRGKGITDIVSALQKIFSETLVESKDKFLKKFIADKNFVRTIISNGEVLKCKAFNRHIDDSKLSNRNNDSATNIEVVRMVAGNAATELLYNRVRPLVLLLIHGRDSIDVSDPRWELYFVVQKKTGLQGKIQYSLIGFTAVYRFYHYPEDSRLRLSQMLVLPTYQHKGFGRYILEVLNDVAISENVYDLTVELPLSHFQHVRTCIDIIRLLRFDPIQHSVRTAVSLLEQGKVSEKSDYPQLMPPRSAIEDVRKNLKINKQQFLQCWEVLIYLSISPVDKNVEDFMNILSSRLKYEMLGKKHSGSSGKQLIEVPSDFEHETSFVMFRSAANKASIVQIDEREVLNLVEDRLKEIHLIAGTVAPQLET